ncbi:MAG: tetratricopeptide repeat protein, partial [Candidatus Poribacteria bacterium]|nr:tetratricopeptide repeat protein [Candidatus Poribacteria bacterium]
MAFGVLSGVKDRLTEMQLGRGEGALKRDKPQAALDIFGKVIESLEDRYKEESEMPDSARALYGRALLLRARALAMNRNVNAVAAYLRARQRVPLEEDDIEFVADHLISTLPRTFMAFPVYVDWYERASDPMDAEAKLRHIARIETDEDAGDSLFDIKLKLNEYFAAHFPSWLWTLEHLANSYEIRGDMDASHSCLVEWRVRDPENATVRCRERIVAAKRHLQNRQTLEALSAYEAAMLSGGDEASDAAYQLLAAAQQTRLGRPQIRRIRRTFEQYALHTKDAELLAEYALWIDAFDTAASLSMFRRVLEIDPTHDRSLWELAKREYQRNEPKHALDLAERYLDRNPTDERARAFAAHIAGERGDYERVIDLMEAVSHHTSTQALLFGEALMKADRFEDAATALDDIDAEDLDDADLVRLECLRADIAFERGEFESAVERYSTLLEDHPDDATLWTRLGRTYLRQGEWKEAAKTFTKALEVDEHAYIARNGRAQAFYRYGDTDAAAKDFRRSLMTNPRQPNTLYAIARCVMRKQPDLAKSFLVRAVDERPDFRAAWLALARLHENGENWSGAAHAYSQIIEQDEKAGRTRDAAISNRHAHVSMRGGDFKTAKAILEARLEQGEDETLLYYLGYCCYHTGDLKGAAERWRASLLRRDDPALRTDLAWLHIRLADASLARDNRVEMIQHWNTARETLPDDVMEGALIQRWAKEALTRLKNRPTPRDVQNAHDLMTDVLHHEPDNPSYQMIAALCAARVGDWGLAEEIIKPLTRDEWWMNPATYLLGVCRHEQNLFDPAVAILDAKRDWGRWEVEAQSLMVQVHLDADDIEGTARELAMLRAMSPEACSADAAVSVFLNMKCWRHARELIQDAPVDARTPFMHYGLAVSALMTQRETEGLDYLDQVTEDSEWHSQAQALRKIGYKRRALRAFQTLGWEEVVESLEQVMETDESDDTVPLWLERARDFAILSRWDAHDGDRIVERWRARLGKEPRNIRPLHQWAVFAYWMAQTQPSPERWRAAMSLWGTLLNQSQYWQAWASARLRRHDPNTWGGASLEEQSWQLQPIIRNLRSKLMTQLTTDMTDATLRIKGTPDELDDLLGDFLREYQTAELWHEWLESNP